MHQMIAHMQAQMKMKGDEWGEERKDWPRPRSPPHCTPPYKPTSSCDEDCSVVDIPLYKAIDDFVFKTIHPSTNHVAAHGPPSWHHTPRRLLCQCNHANANMLTDDNSIQTPLFYLPVSCLLKRVRKGYEHKSFYICIFHMDMLIIYSLIQVITVIEQACFVVQSW